MREVLLIKLRECGHLGSSFLSQVSTVGLETMMSLLCLRVCTSRACNTWFAVGHASLSLLALLLAISTPVKSSDDSKNVTNEDMDTEEITAEALQAQAAPYR